MATFQTRVYFDVGAGWAECVDVLQVPAPSWEYGIDGQGPSAVVATTGIATVYLDNSQANSAGLPGYYSPDHANALAGFIEGIPFKITLSKDGAAAVVKFIGTVAAIRPGSGLFEYPVAQIEAHDWLGFLSIQELGLFPIQSNKRADEALTSVLVNFPVQPIATDFDTGLETFLLMFNTDSARTSMASFFQKLCRNEIGQIYVEGDGTLVFENRNARSLITTSAFTLDGTMSDFSISYERNDIYNYIETQITIAEIDAAATTVLWNLHEQGPPMIKAGETLALICEYSDPDTGSPISAIDAVETIVGYEFGSSADFTSDDLHASLGQNNDAGGNAMIVRLTNNHASKTGYVNDLTILGKGIYIYDPIRQVAEDAASIAIRGLRRYVLKLEQIIDPRKALSYASYLKGAFSNPHFRLGRIRFLANQTDALATGALALEPSTRFIAIEAATGVSYSFYANRIRYIQDGPQLWVEIKAIPAGLHGTFIWGVSHWDDVDDARWSA